MIELTQEQWRAIAQQDHPTLIEPESGTEYVVVPKDEFVEQRKNDAEAALVLRLTWMRRVGLDEEEIAESLRDEPPVDVDAELQELIALERLKNRPSREMLEKIAVKY